MMNEKKGTVIVCPKKYCEFNINGKCISENIELAEKSIYMIDEKTGNAINKYGYFLICMGEKDTRD